MSARAARGSAARVLFWLVMLAGAYWIPRGLQSNADSHLALSFALVEHHSARIDPYAAQLLDKAVYCGKRTQVAGCRHYFTDKAPGISLWVAAVYAVLRPVLPGSMMPTGPKADRFLLRWLLTLLCITAPCAAFAATLWRFYRRFAERGAALLLAIGYAFGTMALPFSILLFSHAVSAALLFWAFMLLFDFRGAPGSGRTLPSWAPALLAGILGGYAIGCEYPTVIIAFLLGLYAAWPQKSRPLPIGRTVGYALGILVGFAPAIIYNLAVFGTPFAGGYTHLTDPYYAHGMARGILGVGLPQWSAVWGTTFDPYRGLFILSPWLLLAAPGLRAMAQRGLTREAWLCGAISVTYFLFQAGYAFWDGGASVGPRQFLPALPFLTFPVLFAIADPRLRRVCRYLIIFSVVQLFLVVATNPLYGDPRYVANVRIPFLNQTLPDLASGRLQNNWGMVFSLPSYFSLLPLVGCLWFAARRLRGDPEGQYTGRKSPGGSL
ncbi:MAG TPA: hypothetical protein VIJ28_19280 [Chloroflexota bacterium]